MKLITLFFVLALSSAAFAGETAATTDGQTVQMGDTAPTPSPSAAPKKKHHHHKKPVPMPSAAPSPAASPSAQ